jgi:LEA14-like dessication related protein
LGFTTPRVALVGVDVERIGLLESTLRVRLRVENPNSFRLPIERGSYTFFLGGERVGTGATRLPLDVPPGGSGLQDVVIELDNAALLPGLRSLLDREVAYRIEAEHVVRLVGERSVRSVSEGEVDLGGG